MDSYYDRKIVVVEIHITIYKKEENKQINKQTNKEKEKEKEKENKPMLGLT